MSPKAPSPNEASIQEDRWIPSACGICYNLCGIRVRRINGTVVKIEGDPNNPAGMGRICPKGAGGGIPLVYDPNRLNVPLKRTNHKKGFDEDPGWVEISWDEALDLVTEKLQQVRREDPRKLVYSQNLMRGTAPRLLPMFAAAFGTPNSIISNGHHCGNAEHRLAGLVHGVDTSQVDFDLCNYLIVFGSGIGASAYYAYSSLTQKMADARMRGMKLVAVDPLLSPIAEKADEWLPIRPGTDGALAMAMLHVLLNEDGLYDAEYLRGGTNSTYLVGRQGRFVRDQATGKPLVWDTPSGSARPFDEVEPKDAALTGEFTVGATAVRPAFVLLQERAKEFPPERAAEITSIPASTIRRVAREFGQAARIGSTITLEGKALPYRPVATMFFKGAHGHNNAWVSSMAMKWLNLVLGAVDVPGGLLGTNPVCLGYPQTGLPHWVPQLGPDGLVMASAWHAHSARGPEMTQPWPQREPKAPERLDLLDLFAAGSGGHISVLLTASDEAQRFGIPYKAEVLINEGSNLVMSLGNTKVVAEALKKLYVINLNLFLDETAHFADVVLPMASYLEQLTPIIGWHLQHTFPAGQGSWAEYIQQPVVPLAGQRRDPSEVLIELAQRLQILPGLNAAMNHVFLLREPYQLGLEEKYAWPDICDRVFKNFYGPEHGLEWFSEHGVLSWPKKLEEVYARPFLKYRVPVYLEWFPDLGRKTQALLDKLGVKDIPTAGYEGLPGWKPCGALEAKNASHDLQAIYYRVAWHQFSSTFENPWLGEVSSVDHWADCITINRATAERKGIKDGDRIWVESVRGDRVRGRAKLSNGVHPEVVAIANNGGHWSKHMPLARGKGVFFEALLPLDWENTDPVVTVLDCDAAVRIYKAKDQETGGRGWE
ncbi:MAG: molybdopterin-dependent oxidoreductase [Chloroflexi bacterium]|nr:molybdopterin-dependent oxidoreductase [Chloroflexota bacterium]